MNHTKLLQSALEAMRGYRQEHSDAQPCDTERAIEAALAEPVVLEAIYETIIQWDEGGGKRSRRELARRIAALYTCPQAREPLTDEAKAVLRECRNQSMKWTGQARIPESGAFGGIAQDLDWLCSQLGITEKGGGT